MQTTSDKPYGQPPKRLQIYQHSALFVGGPRDGMDMDFSTDRRKKPKHNVTRCMGGYTLIENTDPSTSGKYPMVYHYSPSNDTRRK